MGRLIYVRYLTYTAGVSPLDLDAEVLIHVYRRLFAEAREEFRAAHNEWMDSSEALTTDEYLRCLGEALKKERRAFEKQREAIELQKQALDLRAKRWEELKSESACQPSGP